MKKTKEHPSYKRGIFEAQLFDMKQRRIKKEIELIKYCRWNYRYKSN